LQARREKNQQITKIIPQRLIIKEAAGWRSAASLHHPPSTIHHPKSNRSGIEFERLKDFDSRQNYFYQVE